MGFTIRVADQLRGYRETDLRLCFRISKKPVFSRRGSNSLHRDIINNVAFAPSENSEHAGHLPSWVRGFTVHKEKSYPERMIRLGWVMAHCMFCCVAVKFLLICLFPSFEISLKRLKKTYFQIQDKCVMKTCNANCCKGRW